MDDLRVTKYLPTLKISGETAILSIGELRKLLSSALKEVEVDEEWYLNQNPDVRDAIQKKQFASAKDHYVQHGFIERRLPVRPVVDEVWYLETNPDVASAIRDKKFESAFEHYVLNGYQEGRKPGPE